MTSKKSTRSSKKATRPAKHLGKAKKPAKAATRTAPKVKSRLKPPGAKPAGKGVRKAAAAPAQKKAQPAPKAGPKAQKTGVSKAAPSASKRAKKTKKLEAAPSKQPVSRKKARPAAAGEMKAETPYMKEFADESEVKKVIEASRRLFTDNTRVGGSMSLYLKDMNRYPLLKGQEERDLAVRAQKGDEIAEHLLIKHNLRFVIAIAKQYANRGVDLEDLINEGNIGLMRAVKKFNPDRGVKLISYAVHWVGQAIRQALAYQQRAVRVPLNRAAQLSHIHRATEKLSAQLRRMPTPEEIAAETEISPHIVTTLIEIRQADLSLDSNEMAEATAVQGVSLSERIPAESGTVEVLESRFRMRDIDRILEQLKPRDRTILRLHFGLDGGREHTLEEIGWFFGITRERVRQIRDRAVRELKKIQATEELKDYHFDV